MADFGQKAVALVKAGGPKMTLCRAKTLRRLACAKFAVSGHRFCKQHLGKLRRGETVELSGVGEGKSEAMRAGMMAVVRRWGARRQEETGVAVEGLDRLLFMLMAAYISGDDGEGGGGADQHSGTS